jgi:type I restriction enzyme S subunit
MRTDNNRSHACFDCSVSSYYEKTGKSDNHIAYDLPTIPKTWEWIRLNLAISSNIGLTFKPNNVTSHGVPILKANNIRNGQINFEEVTHVSYDTKIKSTEWLSIGDVLMAVRSGSKNLVGKSAVIHDLNDEPTSFGAFMSVIRPLKIEPEYLTIFFESAFFRNQLEEANTTTIYQVTQKMLKESFFPLAPLTEQNRILNRVEQLSRKISELG